MCIYIHSFRLFDMLILTFSCVYIYRYSHIGASLELQGSVKGRDVLLEDFIGTFGLCLFCCIQCCGADDHMSQYIAYVCFL